MKNFSFSGSGLLVCQIVSGLKSSRSSGIDKFQHVSGNMKNAQDKSQCEMFSYLQVDQFWPPDDRKTPNIEGLDGVSIETDLMRKGHCQRFSSEKGRRIRGGGSQTRTKKSFFIHPFLYIPLPPLTNILKMIKNVGFK